CHAVPTPDDHSGALLSALLPRNHTPGNRRGKWFDENVGITVGDFFKLISQHFRNSVFVRGRPLEIGHGNDKFLTREVDVSLRPEPIPKDLTKRGNSWNG